MNFRLTFAVVIIVLLAGPGVLANDFWHRVGTLEIGESSIQFKSSYSHNLGTSQTLGVQSSLYSQAMTWEQMEKALGDQAKISSKNYRTKNQLAGGEVVAEYVYQIESRTIKIIPGWAYGLTDQWTVGFEAPLIHKQYSAKTQFRLGQQFNQYNTSSSGQIIDEDTLFAMAENQANSSELNPQGHSSNQYSLGDVELLSKYDVVPQGEWNFSLLSLIRFPAAPNNSPYEGLFVQDDSGQFDLGLSALWQYQVTSSWNLFGEVGFVSQASDSQQIVWRDSYGTQARLVENVRRDLGDVSKIDVYTEFLVNDFLKFLGGLYMEKKGQDIYVHEDENINWRSSGRSKRTGHLGVVYILSDPLLGNYGSKIAQLTVSKDFSDEFAKEDPSAEFYLQWEY